MLSSVIVGCHGYLDIYNTETPQPFEPLILIPVRTLIAFTLAGWCAILPVLAQACLCYVAQPGTSACCDDGHSFASVRLIKNSCCQSCSTEHTDAPSGIRTSQSENSGEPTGCQCERTSEFEVFSAKLPQQKQVKRVALQAMPMPLSWAKLCDRTNNLATDRPVLSPVPQQTKLASLGVWRL